MQPDPLLQTWIPPGSPTDPQLDPSVLYNNICPCVRQVALTSHRSHFQKRFSRVRGDARRLTVYNCVFTQNRAALASRASGAYRNMNASSFYKTAEISARLHGVRQRLSVASVLPPAPQDASSSWGTLGTAPRPHSLFTSSQQRFSRRPYSSLVSSQHFFGVLRVLTPTTKLSYDPVCSRQQASRRWKERGRE